MCAETQSSVRATLVNDTGIERKVGVAQEDDEVDQLGGLESTASDFGEWLSRLLSSFAAMALPQPLTSM